MKRYKEHLIESLEDSFTGKISMSKSILISNRESNLWNLNKYSHDRYKIEGVTLHTIIIRVLEKFTNKSVNDAFSYYCKLVPKHYQHEFFHRYYLANYNMIESTSYYRRYSLYYIDENNIIKENKYVKPKNKVIFKSWDYNEWIYDVTVNKWFTVNDYISRAYNKWWLRYSSREIIQLRERLQNNLKIDYISGIYKEFDSQKEKEYIKLRAQDIQQRRIIEKRNIKEKKEQEYSFLSRAEKELKQDQAKDLVRRDALGFDENSFKYDPYHGQKRKKKLQSN